VASLNLAIVLDERELRQFSRAFNYLSLLRRHYLGTVGALIQLAHFAQVVDHHFNQVIYEKVLFTPGFQFQHLHEGHLS